ncbi:hypothetical protein MG293_002177 [Ovis ammon polii]|uniref:Uncharacterized protein n=1 Tax=Ovis ammon polii TaxID=230172 RepID=A0AAD4UR86_OVIAM|nr:hypothetical protein MG293_002177 [Ovis ammon polii]
MALLTHFGSPHAASSPPLKCGLGDLVLIDTAQQRGWLRFGDMYRSFPGGSDSKESACNAEDLESSLGQEDPLEKEMATHSSTLAWKIPWTEEPDKA